MFKDLCIPTIGSAGIVFATNIAIDVIGAINPLALGVGTAMLAGYNAYRTSHRNITYTGAVATAAATVVAVTASNPVTLSIGTSFLAGYSIHKLWDRSKNNSDLLSPCTEISAKKPRNR